MLSSGTGDSPDSLRTQNPRPIRPHVHPFHLFIVAITTHTTLIMSGMGQTEIHPMAGADIEKNPQPQFAEEMIDEKHGKSARDVDIGAEWLSGYAGERHQITDKDNREVLWKVSCDQRVGRRLSNHLDACTFEPH